jgi:hypothetical protein
MMVLACVEFIPIDPIPKITTANQICLFHRPYGSVNCYRITHAIGKAAVEFVCAKWPVLLDQHRQKGLSRRRDSVTRIFEYL